MAAQAEFPVIAVLVEQMHPRVCYTLETVLGEFLGMKPRISVWNPDESPQQLGSLPTLHYGRRPHPTLPNLPCNRLLYEDTIRPAGQDIDWNGPLSEQLEATDFLAMIFHRLTQYEFLRPGAVPGRDGHGRYFDTGEGFLVHGLLEQLVATFPPQVQALVRWPEFDYEITIDVDQPWKYLHKPWYVRWGGLVRDLVRGGAGERWRAMRSGKDPFEVLDTVKRLCPANKTTAFFLVGGDHPNDSRFDISMPAYQAYVRKWQEAGIKVGVHPSYRSSESLGMIAAEKKALDSVTGSVVVSRQHYLRYRTPDTFRELIAAGVQTDYTLCRTSGTGSPTGVAFPYRWFDLQWNAVTDLRLVPAVVMDRSLLHLGHIPLTASKVIQETIEAVRALGGRFVVILHNETFSDSGEWRGWRDEVISPMMRMLQG